MRQVSWFPLLLVAGFLGSDCGGRPAPPPATPLGPDLQSYLAAQEALAKDDLAGARQALHSLAGQASAPVQALAASAAATADLEAVRAVFKPLSEELVRRVWPAGYAVASCPMADGGKGARWVQKKDQIRNPYFGASMLRCGAFEEAAAR